MSLISINTPCNLMLSFVQLLVNFNQLMEKDDQIYSSGGDVEESLEGLR